MTERKLIFLRRLGSSVGLWVVALWAIFSGYEPGFLTLIAALTMIGLWEFYHMLDHKRLPNFKVIGLICGALFTGGSFYYLGKIGPRHAQDFELGALLLFHFAVFTRQMFQRTRDVSPLETMAFTLFGLLYVPWLFSFVTKIVYLLPRDGAGHVTGHVYVLWLIVVTKFSDMGAYVTGSLIGRHPLVPHISPKKTWEGFVGALLFSAGGGVALARLMPEKLALLAGPHALLLGVGLGFAAVVGDLAESLIKRSAEVKDSGRMLPGIGGALDLIDSILFTAPLMFFYLRFVLGVG
jgi:phosphatidate cytidylyltransferase